MILFIIIICIIVWFIFTFRHTKIKWNSLFKKGFKKESDIFGIYCYHGKQGCGKTVNCVSFLHENKDSGFDIYANLKRITGVNYTYISGIEQLLTLVDSFDDHGKRIILFDELFTMYSKIVKLDKRYIKSFQRMLSQMRKKGVILLVSAQEWLDVPVDFRRYCKYAIEVSMFNILNRAFIIKRIYDGYSMKWNKDENEYIAPLVSTFFEKGSYLVVNSYDTYEQI